MADLVERLRAYDAKASLIDRLREHDLSSYPEDDDWQDHYCDRADDLLKEAAAALEAEASEGERRGLERAADLVAARVPMHSTRQRQAYEAGRDRLGEARHAQHCEALAIETMLRALIPEAPVRDGWLPIKTAPKDGTVIDLWHEDFGRQADFKWGHTEHSCGEAGQYCDSDWHSEEAGWVDTALNERYFAEDVLTHWRPLPSPPQDNREG